MLRFLGWTLALLVVATLVAGLFFATLTQNAAIIAEDAMAPAESAPVMETAAPPPPAAEAPSADAGDVAPEAPATETYAHEMDADMTGAAPRAGAGVSPTHPPTPSSLGKVPTRDASAHSMVLSAAFDIDQFQGSFCHF